MSRNTAGYINLSHLVFGFEEVPCFAGVGRLMNAVAKMLGEIDGLMIVNRFYKFTETSLG